MTPFLILGLAIRCVFPTHLTHGLAGGVSYSGGVSCFVVISCVISPYVVISCVISKYNGNCARPGGFLILGGVVNQRWGLIAI